MNDTVIRATQIGKKYQIQHSVAAYKTLREDFGRLLRFPFHKEADSASTQEEFWALQDINFEIKAGEQVGLVGANGAGKSTLLKILSRVIQPSTGEIKLKGRIGSLLEVGTGFHPELTGRENIFLNGAVLGMSRSYIREHFDEIVEFAEIGQFLDTAVKHYSSGMYVRLAFSIAAHLDPEILILDEVLSVGDAEFQKKSYKKIETIGGEGRTLIFVSHSQDAVARLCQRAILLERGRIVRDGSIGDTLGQYIKPDAVLNEEQIWDHPENIPGDHIVQLRRARIRNTAGDTVSKVDLSEPIGIEIQYDVLEEGHVLTPNYHIHNLDLQHVFHTIEVKSPWYGRPRKVGCYTSVAWIPPYLMNEGGFMVGVAITTYRPVVHIHFYEQRTIAFQVQDARKDTAARGEWEGPMPGLIRPFLDWTTEYTPSHDNVS